MEESDLPQGGLVVTTHNRHGEATGRMVERGEARVPFMPEGTAGDPAGALRSYGLDPRVHSGDAAS